jgi:hypothetical protein
MMKKVTALWLGTALFLVLIFAGCSQPSDPPKDVETVSISGLAGRQINSKSAYKIYVLFANGQTQVTGHEAIGVLTTDSTFPSSAIVPMKDPSTGNDWVGRANYVSIVLVPKTVDSIEDVEMYAYMSLPNGPEARFNYPGPVNMKTTGLVNWDDVKTLYRDIIVNDTDIDGTKSDPPENRPVP